MPHAVIFDVDGTLVDTNDRHTQAWVRAFRHFGIAAAERDVRRQMGKGGDQLMPLFLDADTLRRQGKAIETYRAELFKREFLPGARAFPDVRALFARLKKDGRRVVLASSGKTDEIRHYMQVADITELVDAITTADDAQHTKPEPDIFAAALDRIFPLKAADAVVVGDSPFDAEAAGKLGLRSIGLLCGGFTEADLKAAGCVAIFDDPSDLLQRYETSPLGI